MGKGDRRTRRGKIYAGSFGKSRPKNPKARSGGASGVAKPAVKAETKKAAAPKPAPKRAKT